MARPTIPSEGRRSHVVQTPVTPGELAELDRLRIALAGADGVPATRATVMRAALHMLAEQKAATP
jgi:hypothetical protein